MQLLIILKLRHIHITVVALLFQCCHLRPRLLAEHLEHLEASLDATIGDVLSPLFIKRLGESGPDLELIKQVAQSLRQGQGRVPQIVDDLVHEVLVVLDLLRGCNRSN